MIKQKEMSRLSNIIKSTRRLAAASVIIASSFIGATAVDAASRPTIKASLDSAYIMMGRQIRLNVTVTNNSSTPGIVMIERDSMPKEVELRNENMTLGETSDIGNGRYEFKGDYIIQSFDSGAYRLPPVMYISGNDTVFSNQVTLKVVPVDVSELADINPEEGPIAIASKWYDWIPDFLTDNWLWILLGLIIIAGGVCAYLILSKKVKVTILPQKKIEPPYEVAIKKLSQLKDEQLWEKGQDKDFYTRLTDILREYLDRRFGINAMEMTSSQIMHAINHREETRLSNKLMGQILEVADFVKFARVKPLREDNIRSFEAAMQFVEDTKPVAPQEAEKPAETKDKEVNSNEQQEEIK